MPLKLRSTMSSVPDVIMDEALMLHPAVDPDSGHLICHRHDVSAAVLEAGDEPYPALLVGSCLAIVTGKRLVEDILAKGDARKASLELSGDVRVPSAESEPYWLLYMISVLRNVKPKAELLTLEVVGPDGESRRVPALRIRADDANETLLISLAPCRRPEDQRPAGTLYL